MESNKPDAMPDPDTEAIEAELEAITRGEWHYDGRVGCVAVYAGAFRECLSASYETFLFYRPGKWVEKSDGTEAHWTADEQACKDAVFIAHAPANVRNLLDDRKVVIDRVKELEAEVEQLKSQPNDADEYLAELLAGLCRECALKAEDIERDRREGADDA